MPLDPALAGRSYPPAPPYQVGREKIREFATAIGAADPVHHDVDAARALGHLDLVAPPTFAIVISGASLHQVYGDPELALDFSRVVHGDQRFVHTRPIHAGDEIVCVHHVEEITVRGGHSFLTTRSALRTASGEPVADAYAKLVVRGED
ncbi:UPF0336 protein [Pilimelia terevasa]|uniref:UPF0336 protein GCM10010124_02640 n=1 Tax=Pilimelia terevasa TaxID=53372 RepID=A0A8J3BEE1_9ACTN|nr:MaoC family dehydratase N-terminal domain-containing protein [Pilimelia terevasa]GGK13523.1 UPF0336 protein [Pilimelia terevasa]